MVKKITLALAIALVAQITWAQSIVSNNVSLVEASINRYALRSVNNPILLKVKNNGNSTINSLKVNWNDGLEDHIAIVETEIPAGETAVISHPVPVNYSNVVEKNITVSVDMVNASTDNNIQTLAFNTVAKRATKAVVFEEATGTWCGWCPGGAVNMDNMKKKYPKTFIGIAVHGGRSEPMKYNEYYNYGDKIGIFGGYPTYGCDRANSKPLGIEGEMSMEGPYKQRINEEAPADLFASATLSGSNLKINAGAQFYSSFSNAKFKLSVVITEDGIRGKTSGYNQANYYSGGSRGKMGGYENKPRTVPARDMVYDHVARAVLGSFSGQSGSVPSKIKAGDKAEYGFSYKIPSSYNKDKLNIIVLLLDSRGQIVNGKEIHLDQALSVEKAEIASMKMYPNPVKNNLTIDFDATDNNYSVSIYDLTGRSIYNKEHSNLNGMQSLNIPLNGLKSGNYLVNVASNKASHSQLIIVE